MREARVHVVILNWNSAEDTLRCVQHLQQSDYRNFEVTVLDNGSTDDSVERLRSLQGVQLVALARNLGYTGGNNLVMQEAVEAGVDYVWLLNNDAHVAPDCLGKLVRTAESDPRIGLVSPVIYDADQPGAIQHCCARFDIPSCSLHGPADLKAARTLQEESPQHIALYGTALLVKAEVVRRIGLLDDALFAYFEDIDYSIRSAQAGFRNLAVLDAAISHRSPKGVRRAHYYYFYTRNDYLMWRKYLGASGRFKAACWNLLRTRRMLTRLAGHPELIRASLAGLWDGWMGRAGAFDETRSPPVWLQMAVPRQAPAVS